MATLRRGLSGDPVRRLQAKLGVPEDGEFSPNTEKALKEYQQNHGLKVDGIVDPDAFAQMELYELILLKVGTSGEIVKRLQTALEIPADGQFGSSTEEAVKAFQEQNALEVDGVAGPLTLSKMDAFKEFTPEIVAASQVQVNVWDTVKIFFK